MARNDDKGPLFTTDQRVEMVRAEVARFGPAVEVRPFSSLLMHFAEELDATVIVRGLRAVADFEYEFQMTAMNQRLNADIETVFLIPWGAYFKQLSCAVPLANGVCPTGQVSFFGLGEMLVFMAILLVGLVYVWKKGALQWD